MLIRERRSPQADRIRIGRTSRVGRSVVPVSQHLAGLTVARPEVRESPSQVLEATRGLALETALADVLRIRALHWLHERESFSADVVPSLFPDDDPISGEYEEFEPPPPMPPKSSRTVRARVRERRIVPPLIDMPSQEFNPPPGE